MSNKLFKYYQPNKKDLKDKYCDDVVRAISRVENTDWLRASDMLYNIARESQCMMFEKLCYEEFLRNNGYVYHGISNKRGSVRPTVASFTKDHKIGTYVLVIAHWLVASVDGLYYDTWDCGEKCLYGYWEKM